jgi:hypothetical protein
MCKVYENWGKIEQTFESSVAGCKQNALAIFFSGALFAMATAQEKL